MSKTFTTVFILFSVIRTDRCKQETRGAISSSDGGNRRQTYGGRTRGYKQDHINVRDPSGSCDSRDD